MLVRDRGNEGGTFLGTKRERQNWTPKGRGKGRRQSIRGKWEVGKAGEEREGKTKERKEKKEEEKIR